MKYISDLIDYAYKSCNNYFFFIRMMFIEFDLKNRKTKNAQKCKNFFVLLKNPICGYTRSYQMP